MSNRVSASISTIWTNVMIEGEDAKISIVNGMAKILFSSCGFDIPIPGKFYDVRTVVQAYKDQMILINKMLENSPDGGGLPSWESSAGADIAADLGLPDEHEPPRGGVPKCLVPISEDELESLTSGLLMVEDLSKNRDDD